MISISSTLKDLRASANRGRARAAKEEGVALLTAILFMLLAAGLSVVLLSVILTQATPVFIAQKNTRTIYAAQAGVQASIGVVRSLAQTDIVTGKTTGIRAKLPCSVAGKVDGNDATSTYSVTMKYFMVDPTGRDTSWQDANDLDCSGTVLAGTTQPLYALALADGIGAGVPGKTDVNYGNRYISAVYQFKVTNVNISGGRIWDYGLGYCLEANSATVGSQVVFKSAANCTSASNATQLWVYDVDYEIKLASTTVAPQTALCISSPTDAGATTAVAGAATLVACRSDATRWNQLWSWFGQNTWQGQKSDNSDYSSFCLNGGNPAAGTVLTVTSTSGCGSGFSPSTAVGAGAASYATNQMVNYKEFGRCADVTNEDITMTFMISYPCKQDPSGGSKLKWNHKWFYTEPTLPSSLLNNQQIVVYNLGDPTQNYCLTSPAAGNKLVAYTKCKSSNTTTQRWTRFLDTGTYSTSYLFTDYLGRCLAVDPTDTYTSGQWSKMIVANCNGGLEQKWNAPASYSDSNVSSYKEYSK